MTLIGFTYRQFSELQSHPQTSESAQGVRYRKPLFQRISDRFDPRETIKDFDEFRRLPVFYSMSTHISWIQKIDSTLASLSIASIYLTVGRFVNLFTRYSLTLSFPKVLSFDGTMLTFLKNSRHYSDPFIAGQRAACTIGGLTGTLLFPIVSRKMGLIRTGSWSIWLATLFMISTCSQVIPTIRFEFCCLIPVVVSLYVTINPSDENYPAWNATLLFGGQFYIRYYKYTEANLITGMALSRIGLWMFDLAQLQILQESLELHPRRNRLTSFQYMLQVERIYTSTHLYVTFLTNASELV